ncbi:DUF4214 domain-containing protein [Variovorax rhizosphaerae]|uniref:DUF4214 domain-containing protein n=1 Tax=Variovorax rhizosphaerae TaxID=1836200 RepID=UPI003BF540DC
MLGRPADPDGLNHFVHAMRDGMSREEVIRELEASEEAQILREMPSYLVGHVSADRRLINDGQRLAPRTNSADRPAGLEPAQVCIAGVALVRFTQGHRFGGSIAGAFLPTGSESSCQFFTRLQRGPRCIKSKLDSRAASGKGRFVLCCLARRIR